MRIAPAAKMDDGWLDVVVVGDVILMRLLEAIPCPDVGRSARLSEVMRFRCRRVQLGTDRVALVHGDGEQLGHSPAEFEVVPGAVLVVA